jgi:hypothetical protein
MPPLDSERPEPIARIALRAPKVPSTALDPQQELLRAIASSEGRMLADASDWRERFEEKIRAELKQSVIREVRSIPPPPPPPPPKRISFDWGHLQYLAGIIVAMTGLIALFQNCQKPSPEVLKRFDAIDKAQADTSKKLTEHIESDKSDKIQDYEYKLSVRSWITDVLERASGVKIDDPPGTPKRDPLGFYPAPIIDPNKISSAHPVQPRDPYPVPPPPP